MTRKPRLPDDLRVEMLGKSPTPGTGRETRYRCLRAADPKNVAEARRALEAIGWRNTDSTLRAFDEQGYLRLGRRQD